LRRRARELLLKPDAGRADDERRMDTPDLSDHLFERVPSAAFSDDAHRRGWDAVRTAARLRREGEHERALALLDEVVDRFEHEDVLRAAYACAVAVHCDLGNPGRAILVGLPAFAGRPTLEVGYALARAYWEHFLETDDAADRDAWLALKAELEALESGTL
jgi:hypothetical protein